MQKIFKTTIRLNKQDSSTIYFYLESNENIVFYSTLESSLKEGYRDIEIKGSIDFIEDFKRMFQYICTKIKIQTIQEIQIVE